MLAMLRMLHEPQPIGGQLRQGRNVTPEKKNMGGIDLHMFRSSCFGCFCFVLREMFNLLGTSRTRITFFQSSLGK